MGGLSQASQEIGMNDVLEWHAKGGVDDDGLKNGNGWWVMYVGRLDVGCWMMKCDDDDEELGGGFKYVLFSPLLAYWGKIPFWLIFFKGVETTN